MSFHQVLSSHQLHCREFSLDSLALWEKNRERRELLEAFAMLTQGCRDSSVRQVTLQCKGLSLHTLLPGCSYYFHYCVRTPDKGNLTWSVIEESPRTFQTVTGEHTLSLRVSWMLTCTTSLGACLESPGG